MVFTLLGVKIVTLLQWKGALSHPFFIPEDPRWPSLAGISAFLFIIALWFKLLTFKILIIGNVVLPYVLTSWSSDLLLESNEGRMTIRVQNNIITAFKIFLISESMIFFSCFSGCTDIGLLPNIFLINNFPPNGALPIFPFGIPSSNLFLLLYSSLPLQGGQIWIKLGVKGRTNEGLSHALGTGVLFLVLQLKEYTAAFFTLSDSIFGSDFYGTSGLHGLHVTTGLLGFSNLESSLNKDEG